MRPSRKAPLIAAICLFSAPACGANFDSRLLYDTQGRAAINAYVNEQGPFLFAIDTAAQLSMLSRDVIEAVGLVADPENKAQLHGAGGLATVDMYQVSSLRVADLERRDLLLPEPAHERESDALGLIGADFFRGLRVEFDFANDELRVGAYSGSAAGDYEILPAQFAMGVFTIIEVQINGVGAVAIVDTGSTDTMANLALFDALELSREMPALSNEKRPVGVTGNTIEFVDGLRADVSFNQAVVRNAPVSFADLPVFGQFGLSERPAIILGLDTLKLLGAIAIDYEQSTFAVKVRK